MEIEKVSCLIHMIRGRRVMLDEDLARLYEVPTKYLNQQVRRNILRFPEDFMFRLTAEESSNLRLRFATSSSKWGGRRYWPMAFTQEGASNLSSVLGSPRAIEVNVAIMRAFVKLSNALTANPGLAERVEKLELALEALEAEQGEQAVAIHEVLAAFRRQPDDDARDVDALAETLPSPGTGP